jgi:hypothetical protein
MGRHWNRKRSLLKFRKSREEDTPEKVEMRSLHMLRITLSISQQRDSS